MKKLISIILLSLTLSGCFYQNINSNDIDTAILKCKEHDSTVVGVNSHFDTQVVVICSNRKSYYI